MKMETLTTTATRPRWAGSYGERLTLLSGGAKLNGANFPLVNGKRNVPSGTLVSRDAAAGAPTFGTFNPAHAQFGFVWLDVTDTGATPDVEIYTAGEVRLDRLPTALTAEQITALRGAFVLTTGDL